MEAREYEQAWALFKRADKAKAEQEPGWLEYQQARVDYRAGRYADAQKKLETYVQQKLRLGGQTPYQLLQNLLEKLPSLSNDVAVDSASDDATSEEPSEAESTSTNITTEPTASENRPGILTSFRDWLANDPDNFPLLSYVAEITRRDGGLADAAKLYEKSVATQPTLEGYVGLMSTYRQMGDASGLLHLLALTLHDLESVATYENEVQKVVANKKLLRQLFELIRNREKRGTVKQTEIAVGGVLAIAAKDYSSAHEFWSKVDKVPEQLELLISWGIRYLASGEADRAIDVFETALKSGIPKENSAPIRYYLAGALQLSGKTEEALEIASQAAQIASDVPEITIRPAWILYNAERNDEAYERYQSWLAKYAEDYSAPGIRESVRDARFVMSNICIEQQRVDEAIEWLEQILDEYPTDVGALNDLGYLLVDQEKCLPRATEMIRMAVEAEPDNVAYRDSLGWALFRAGNHAEAIQHLRKAAFADEPDPIILDHLGDAQFASGDDRAATKTWQRALRLISKQEELTPAEQELEQSILRKLMVGEPSQTQPVE